MRYLTPAEQERLAYAEGYTETAAVLARLDDAHAALGDEAAMQAEIDDMRDKLDAITDARDAERDAYMRALREADDWHEQVKTYRAALMALESVVSPGMREFIREVLA